MGKGYWIAVTVFLLIYGGGMVLIAVLNGVNP